MFRNAKQAKRAQRVDVYLHFLNIGVAVIISVIQTNRIISEIKRKNKIGQK